MQILKFAAGSALANGFGLCVAFGTNHLSNASVFAGLLGFLAAASAGFFIQRRFTFKLAEAFKSAKYKYGLLYGTGFCINALITHLFHEVLGLSFLSVQTGSVIVIGIGMYLGQRFWVFRDKLKKIEHGRKLDESRLLLGGNASNSKRKKSIG